MGYLVLAYGDDAEDEKKFESYEKAALFLASKAKKWCRDNEIDPSEAESFTDDYFYCGIDEQGVRIYKLYEIPEFHNKVEELLFEAKLEMDLADFAAEDYKWSLTECGVSDHVYQAQELLDKATKILQMEHLITDDPGKDVEKSKAKSSIEKKVSKGRSR